MELKLSENVRVTVGDQTSLGSRSDTAVVGAVAYHSLQVAHQREPSFCYTNTLLALKALTQPTVLFD